MLNILTTFWHLLTGSSKNAKHSKIENKQLQLTLQLFVDPASGQYKLTYSSGSTIEYNISSDCSNAYLTDTDNQLEQAYEKTLLTPIYAEVKKNTKHEYVVIVKLRDKKVSNANRLLVSYSVWVWLPFVITAICFIFLYIISHFTPYTWAGYIRLIQWQEIFKAIVHDIVAPIYLIVKGIWRVLSIELQLLIIFFVGFFLGLCIVLVDSKTTH